MARTQIHDFKLPTNILKSAAMRRLVDDKAEEIADHMRSQGIAVEGEPGDVELPIQVSSYTTDRARATVWVAHPSGIAVQAKHGIVGKAASAAGLTIKGD